MKSDSIGKTPRSRTSKNWEESPQFEVARITLKIFGLAYWYSWILVGVALAWIYFVAFVIRDTAKDLIARAHTLIRLK